MDAMLAPIEAAGPDTAGVYKVHVPVFEGPLDLLLQLIERAELDITTVALAQVTEQYLSYIHSMQVPADEISEFVVMAAKLLQIKSEALLPRPPVRELGEEDVGEALVRQLTIYKRFKEIANLLLARQDAGLRSYLRLAPPPKLESHLDLSNLTLTDLMAAATLVYAEEQEKQALETVIRAPRITIREKIALITKAIQTRKTTSFGELIEHKASRLEVVVTFLALLELVKRFAVSARQGGLFSEIEIERLEEWREDEEFELEFE